VSWRIVVLSISVSLVVSAGPRVLFFFVTELSFMTTCRHAVVAERATRPWLRQSSVRNAASHCRIVCIRTLPKLEKPLLDDAPQSSYLSLIYIFFSYLNFTYDLDHRTSNISTSDVIFSEVIGDMSP